MENLVFGYSSYVTVMIFMMMILFFMNMPHILNLLLIYEMGMIGLVILVCSLVSLGIISGYMMMIFLLIMVTESVLGLGLLVSLIRSHGEENMGVVMMLKW